MTQDQINLAIYISFYQVIPNAAQLNQADFLAATIQSTWPLTPPPTMFPTLWYDAVAHQIQAAFRKNGQFLPGFDGTWLKNNTSLKWSDLASWAGGTNPKITGGLVNVAIAA